MRIPRSSLGWGLILLGLAGSLAVTAAGADLLSGKPINWWFHPRLAGREPIFFGGIACLCIAWLAIGRRLHGAALPELLLVGAVWALPLAVGPALFSLDLYSYLADGTLLHLGLSPYHHAPDALASVHRADLMAAVSPFWRHTTAPYGPLFLGLSSVIAAVVGSKLIAGVLLLRGVEAVGVILLAAFVPRLARSMGADPVRAVWLAVISPVVLLELIAAGHNDALMAGLLVAGVALALERRPALGIALCAVAATVKLPAAAGVLFIALCWWRESREDAVKVAAVSVGVTLGVFAIVGAVTGLELGWVSGSMLSTPEKVRIAITPSTAIGYSGASVLHALDIAVAAKGLESAVAAVMLALTGLLGLALCLWVRYQTLALYLGVLLLVSVVGGPAAWPWYLSWGLALVAATTVGQSWRWLPVVIAATSFLVRADGRLVPSRHTAPFVLAVYAAAILIAWWRRPARGRIAGLGGGKPTPALTS